MHLSDYQDLETLFEFYESGEPLMLGEVARQNILRSYEYLQNCVRHTRQPIYGINTGFGALCNTSISSEDLTRLQYNLLRSHAAGIGNIVPQPIVKWMLLLKVLHLAKGYSGVSLPTVQRLIDFYNQGVMPVVYEQGSLGASGDLAPLAHLCLPLIGEGEVLYQGQRCSGKDILERMGWSPLSLMPKEGLALLNGTQFMNAYGNHILMNVHKAWQNWLRVAALSCEAFDCLLSPFEGLLHQIRPHPGQVSVAQSLYNLLAPSANMNRPKPYVQDPYSFRCIPQVLGASLDAIHYAHKVFEIETNAVSDNPSIFVEANRILSGGNFHGQPLALALDFLAIALSEVASISERRIYCLLSGSRGLKPFLAFEPGLESGLMIAQYTAAALVNENKQLCTPNSVDTIPSSNGQEDHVSMGANAAVKCLKVLQNTQKVIAIEFLSAYRAIQIKNLLPDISPALQQWVLQYQKQHDLPPSDFYLSPAILQTLHFLETS